MTRQVLKYKPKCILIHDFEIFRYRYAARGMDNVHIFKAFIPNTGLLWEDNLINKDLVTRVDVLIGSYSKHISPDDTKAWAKLFSAELR